MLRSSSGLVLGILVLFAVAGLVRAETKGSKNEQPDFWGAQKVWDFHVTVAEGDWNAMQPQRPSRWGALFGGLGRREEKPATRPAGDGAAAGGAPRARGPAGNSFGIEFPHVFCTVEFEGKTYADVAIRLKGNSSYALAKDSLKKPFKLDFNRFTDDGAFGPAGGVTLLNFNNNAMDPSQIREALSYRVFRDAGVPASRTAFARVFVTVPNVHDRTYFGLYTVVEEVNKDFLNEHFSSSKGLLVKPEGVRGFDYKGDEWRHYHAQYDAKGGHTPANKRRFVEFLKLVDEGDDESFQRRIREFVDLDEFARFLAVNTVLSNTDSLLGMGHNYYIYLEPKTDRLRFIPWDLNLALGGFMMAGTHDQQMELSVDRPHVEHSNLLKRLLAMERFREEYRAQVEGVLARNFRVDEVHAEVDALQKLVAAAVEQEKALYPDDGQRPVGPWRPASDLKPFVEGRVRSIREQLAGKAEGTPPLPARSRARPAPAPAPAADDAEKDEKKPAEPAEKP